MSQAYPLQWPAGWPRTTRRQQSRYKLSFDRSYNQLRQSLKLLGAEPGSIVVSTNIPLRPNGVPYKTEDKHADPGVAVYWVTQRHGERVMACDRWLLVHENVHAIGLAIEGLRAIERAGATQILDRAFTAFGALPAATDTVMVKPWWEVLELEEKVALALSFPMLKARYRELAKTVHPDHAGSAVAMQELNRALADAEREVDPKGVR